MLILNESKTVQAPLRAMLAGAVMAVAGVGFGVVGPVAPAYAQQSRQSLPEKKQTSLNLYLTAREAADMLRDRAVILVDVRSRAEVTFVGLPTRANVNIPLMVLPPFPEYDAKKGKYRLERNEDFEADFSRYAAAHGIGKDTPIILICRSGSRSARAAELLAAQGYSKVYSVIDGFEGDKAGDGPAKGQRVVNGWKNAGLPWSYKISPEQVYPEDL